MQTAGKCAEERTSVLKLHEDSWGTRNDNKVPVTLGTERALHGHCLASVPKGWVSVNSRSISLRDKEMQSHLLHPAVLRRGDRFTQSLVLWVPSNPSNHPISFFQPCFSIQCCIQQGEMKCSTASCILAIISPAPKKCTSCIALLVETQNKREQVSTHKPALAEYINPHTIISGIFLRRLVYKIMMI